MISKKSKVEFVFMTICKGLCFNNIFNMIISIYYLNILINIYFTTWMRLNDDHCHL